MRRHTEGLLEGAAEVTGAQPHELRELGERYRLRKVFCDIVGDDPLLPRRKTASHRRIGATSTCIEAYELMRQHDAKRFAIAPTFRAVLNQPRQFDCRLP